MSRRRLIARKDLEKPVKLGSCCCGSEEVYIEINCFGLLRRYVYRVTCQRCGLRGSQEQYRNSITLAVSNWNSNTRGFQDIERTWMTVDQVYETRWDCMAVPERVRQAA